MSGSHLAGEVDDVIEPKRLTRRAVRNLPQYKTGVSPRLLEALRTRQTVARLGSNENLYGPSPRVYDAIRSADDVHLYPDGRSTAVREALGAHLDIDPDRFLVSTGSENVLFAVIQCAVAPGDRVVSVAPTFLLPEILSRAIGADYVGVRHRDDLTFSAEALVEEIERGVKLLYLSNPNNPTGNAFSPAELHTIFEATSPETLVVIDEAYYEYAIGHDGYASSLDALAELSRPYVVLRTLSKAYGLAGFRVGYGICYHPDLVLLARRASTIFDVGTVAQKAALAALEDQSHMRRTVEQTLSEKRRVLTALEAMNVRVFPSFGNFVTLWYPKRERALRVESELADRAVFVKALPSCAGEGVLRVTIGREQDNDLFLRALGAAAAESR